MRYLLTIFAFVLLTACRNRESAVQKPLSENTAYYDVQVWAEEGRDDATLRLQLRDQDENGAVDVLDSGTQLYFDRTPFAEDSAKFNGTFYELVKPVEELSGEHSFVRVDANAKEHTAPFTFQPFVLAEEIPESLPRRPFELRLTNFPAASTGVRLVMTDTSLYSTGVNEVVQVRSGLLPITAEQLSHLAAGPVTLEIISEQETPMDEKFGANGSVRTTYSLRRAFVLTEK